MTSFNFIEIFPRVEEVAWTTVFSITVVPKVASWLPEETIVGVPDNWQFEPQVISDEEVQLIWVILL